MTPKSTRQIESVDAPQLSIPVSDDCEPGATGSATLCFYSLSPPSIPDASIILVKNGQEICVGTVDGEFPLMCPTPTFDSTWSDLKGEF